MFELLPAEIAWYVTGRFYLDTDGALADYGYFLHWSGIAGALFDGPIAETAAHFTFAARPFVATPVNNGALRLSLDPAGEFSVYLQRRPAASFADPASFAAGERIATFRRTGLVVGTTIESATAPPAHAVISTNLFSARLIDSVPFEFGGRRHDLRAIIGAGVTQQGVAAAAPIASPSPRYTAVLPFTGSAIKLG